MFLSRTYCIKYWIRMHYGMFSIAACKLNWNVSSLHQLDIQKDEVVYLYIINNSKKLELTQYLDWTLTFEECIEFCILLSWFSSKLSMASSYMGNNSLKASDRTIGLVLLGPAIHNFHTNFWHSEAKRVYAVPLILSFFSFYFTLLWMNRYFSEKYAVILRRYSLLQSDCMWRHANKNDHTAAKPSRLINGNFFNFNLIDQSKRKYIKRSIVYKYTEIMTRI